MQNDESKMKIGDVIVGIIVFLPSILLLLFSLIVLAGMIAGLVKLITIWF